VRLHCHDTPLQIGEIYKNLGNDRDSKQAFNLCCKTVHEGVCEHGITGLTISADKLQQCSSTYNPLADLPKGTH